MQPDLRKDLEAVINKHSVENGSDTPDYVLAAYLIDCIATFDTAVNNRERFYNRLKKIEPTTKVS